MEATVCVTLCIFSGLLIRGLVCVCAHPCEHGSITFAGVALDAAMYGVIVSTKVLGVGFLIHNNR